MDWFLYDNGLPLETAKRNCVLLSSEYFFHILLIVGIKINGRWGWKINAVCITHIHTYCALKVYVILKMSFFFSIQNFL